MTFSRKKFIKFILFSSWLFIVSNPQYVQGQELTVKNQTEEGSVFLPLSKYIWKVNFPILTPTGNGFERDRVYNPTAIVERDTIYMIYRAEGKNTGAGFLGLAKSVDGINFTRYEKNPIMKTGQLFDKFGCEDPRVVKFGDEYYLFYVGNDNKSTAGNICMAISDDLIYWEKQGEILQPKMDWESKQIKAPAPIPQKINDKYWMYYQGEREAWRTKMGLAYSDDLIHWTPASGEPVMKPREGYFDSWGVEPGTAVIMDKKILLVYNGWGGDGSNTNKTGWALFSREDPAKLIARCDSPIISLPHNHVFTEGLIRFNDKWLLYYGSADRWIEGIIIDFEGILDEALKK